MSESVAFSQQVIGNIVIFFFVGGPLIVLNYFGSRDDETKRVGAMQWAGGFLTSFGLSQAVWGHWHREMVAGICIVVGLVIWEIGIYNQTR